MFQRIKRPHLSTLIKQLNAGPSGIAKELLWRLTGVWNNSWWKGAIFLCREAVRQPLEDKKAELEKELLSGQGELQEKLKKIKEMRQQLKQLSTKLQIRYFTS
jgi:hypothetical protein